MSGHKRETELNQFKAFINDHPKLRREIRKNGKSWQDIYEQWVLLGEEDEHWVQYKEESTEHKESEEKDSNNSKAFDLKPDLVKQVLKYAESVDVNKLQNQVQQLSKTIGTIQEVVNQYQSSDSNANKRRTPNWFMD